MPHRRATARRDPGDVPLLDKEAGEILFLVHGLVVVFVCHRGPPS